MKYDISDEELEQRARDYMAEEAIGKAEKYLKKHQREIKRLKDHIENAIFELDVDKYEYAINKLKSFYRQKPLTRKEAEDSFKATVENVATIIKSNI